MKLSRTTFILLTTAGLVVFLIFLAKRADSSKESSNIQIVTNTVTLVITNTIQTDSSRETNQFSWAQLESEDYRTYITRLRSIGCPEQTIRDIIISDLDKLLAPRIQAVHSSTKDLKYWEPEEKDLVSSRELRERQRQQREIDFEKREIILELLGVDLVNEKATASGATDQFGRRLGFLPEDKRSRVRMLLEHYNHEELNIREKTWEEGETLTRDDKAQLARISQEKQAAIASTLTPSELEQYELAMSNTAYQVRDALTGLNPTEEEFLALYKLRKPFDETWSREDLDLNDPVTMKNYINASNVLERQIRSTLGEQRYAEYSRAQDQDYRQAKLVAKRFQLPESKAQEVYQLKQTVLEFRSQVNLDPLLSADQKQAALQGIQQEAEQVVRETLGDRAFNYYKRNSKAEWLD